MWLTYDSMTYARMAMDMGFVYGTDFTVTMRYAKMAMEFVYGTAFTMRL